jgi:hypothetical protein
LQEVHRLLAASDFATADDLVRRGGLDHLATRHRPAPPAPSPSTASETTSHSPLPRRR